MNCGIKQVKYITEKSAVKKQIIKKWLTTTKWLLTQVLNLYQTSYTAITNKQI